MEYKLTSISLLHLDRICQVSSLTNVKELTLAVNLEQV